MIVGLLALVYLSYRQTISTYPNGGGSYTVAKTNLGTGAGLVAAAALMLDYVLVVAVGISAGIGALISVLPSLQPYTLPLCLAVLVIVTLVNLRGVRESGAAFIIPTYVFAISLLTVVAIGLVKVLLGDTTPVDAPPLIPPVEGGATVSLWLLVRAFSSGCTAMTGVEAVSNGTPIFKASNAHNARIALGIIVGLLSVLLLGIAFLAKAYGVAATEPGSSGYESVLSQLVGAVIGKGFIYFITLGAVISVLCLSANTGFADFPRLCRVMATEDYLPHAFAERGRRLVFTAGAMTVAVSAGALLIVFSGVTDRLIPLFAVGAFLAFTLSQLGMVVHWQHIGKKPVALMINLLFAIGTAAALVVMLASKFTESTWITLLLIPSAVLIFTGVKRHYESVATQIASSQPLEVSDLEPPLVIVPIKNWDSIARKALRFAMKLSPNVHAVHVQAGESPSDLEVNWDARVVQPALAAQKVAPKLIELPSPYRSLFGPLLGYIGGLENRQIAVIVPELVEHRPFHYWLHNQRATLLKAALLFRNDRRIVVVNVPWYLED